MNRQQHWNQVYQTKGPQEVSWYQRRPDFSLALIAASGVGKDDAMQEVRRETHSTPWQSEQRFIYFRFQWQPGT